MKTYHYSDGTNSFGPFTIEELKYKNISADTLVWTEGMVTWCKAKDIPEIEGIITSSNTPPSIPTNLNTQSTPYQNNTQNFERPPKTYLIESIIATILCCWPIGIVSIVYAARVEKKFYAGDKLGAEQDSNNAKKWMTINIVAAILIYVIYFGIFGIAAISGLTA